MTDIPTSQEVSFLDNPGAPDVYADAASGWFHVNGNIRITFESARASHVSTPGPINRVVIGRLVMPIERAEEMAKGLLDFIEQQRAQTVSSPQGTPTIQ